MNLQCTGHANTMQKLLPSVTVSVTICTALCHDIDDCLVCRVVHDKDATQCKWLVQKSVRIPDVLESAA